MPLGKATFSSTLSHGKRADSWNISAGRSPLTWTWPDEGVSRPATSPSIVDLPHPDAPTTHTNSPFWTDSDIVSRATTASRP